MVLEISIAIMQTFLPHSNFSESAKVLDMRRLGKQRVESYQILNCLTIKESKWKNHPAVLMWKKSKWWLSLYSIEICSEWIGRGYKDSLLTHFVSYCENNEIDEIPFWLGDERLHSSHRSNLLRKDFNFYSKFNWIEENNLEYFWPVRKK